MDAKTVDALKTLPPHEQKRVIERFRQLIDYKKENPLYFYNHPELNAWRPHTKQLLFHEINVKHKAFFGGNQSGKTTAGVADDLIQACDADILPEHLRRYKKWQPPFYWRVFTPDLSTTMDLVQEKMKELTPYSQLYGESWDKAYDKQKRVLRFKNGSTCWWNSYDQDLDKLGGITLMRNHYDEEPPRLVWEESQPRLTRYNGDEIFTMTPLKGLSWTFSDVWGKSGGDDEALDRGEYVFIGEKYASVVVDMDDNPILTEEAKADTLASYDAATRQARKSGRFVHVAGMIYNEFKEDLHTMVAESSRPFENKNVNVVVAIDPGFNRCAVIWGAIRLDGVIEIFEEIYVENWKIGDVAERIHEANAYHGVEPIYYVIDPHAKDTSKQTGRSDQSEFSDHGIVTVLGQNAVSAGISRVKDKLASGTLKIHKTCPNLIREFKMYRWKEAAKRTEEDRKDEPIKKDDHALDALRYLIMSRPYVPIETVEDKRTRLQKLMDDDKERVDRRQPVSEYGGGIYM
jgi:PBSX family phage terminase large subunit